VPATPPPTNTTRDTDHLSVPVCRGVGEPEVRTNVQSFERRGFQSRSLANAATGPSAFYMHPEVGLAHRSTGLKNESRLCQSARADAMGEVNGDVLGGTGSLVQEMAATDRSSRGASIEHWQGASAGGRFGERAMYEALRTSTLY
jgi:hypothetical protein